MEADQVKAFITDDVLRNDLTLRKASELVLSKAKVGEAKKNEEKAEKKPARKAAKKAEEGEEKPKRARAKKKTEEPAAE